jgi:hypothetical protein
MLATTGSGSNAESANMLAATCVTKLRTFLEDPDQNCTFVAILCELFSLQLLYLCQIYLLTIYLYVNSEVYWIAGVDQNSTNTPLPRGRAQGYYSQVYRRPRHFDPHEDSGSDCWNGEQEELD